MFRAAVLLGLVCGSAALAVGGKQATLEVPKAATPEEIAETKKAEADILANYTQDDQEKAAAERKEKIAKKEETKVEDKRGKEKVAPKEEAKAEDKMPKEKVAKKEEAKVEDKRATEKVAQKEEAKAEDKTAKEKVNKKEEAKKKAEEEAKRKELADKERKAAEEKSRLKALEEEDAKLKKEAEQKAKQRAAQESARRKQAAKDEAERQAREAEWAAEDAKQNARLQQIQGEKAKKHSDVVEAKSRANALDEKKNTMANSAKLRDAQRKSREEDEYSDASSRSSQDILERLLRTFVHTAAGTLRVLADETGASGPGAPQTDSCNVPVSVPLQMEPFNESQNRINSKDQMESKAQTESKDRLHSAPHTRYPALDSSPHASLPQFNSTAPPSVGFPRPPVVPPLWQPHPRSDGFIGFRPPPSCISSDASEGAPSEPATGRLQETQLPTFAPQTNKAKTPPDENAATLPYPPQKQSELPVFQPSSASGPKGQQVEIYEKTRLPAQAHRADANAVTPPRQFSPYAAVPGTGNLVDPEIMNQLAALLCAPDTPKGDWERYAQPPASYQPPPYQPPVYQAPSYQPYREPEPQKLASPPAQDFGAYEKPMPKQREDSVGSWQVPAASPPMQDFSFKQDSYSVPSKYDMPVTPSETSSRTPEEPTGNWALPSPPRPTSASQYSDASAFNRKNALSVPQKHIPAASDVSSAAWSAPFADTLPQNKNLPERVLESRQAERNAEFGIPSLPLANITSSSFGVSSGPKELGMAFSQALDQLTNAMYRSAEALGSASGQSGGSSRPSWDHPPPLPMPVSGIPFSGSERGRMTEDDWAYRAPFSNYAGLKVDYTLAPSPPPEPQQPPPVEGYDKEIREVTRQFASLSGRSDASSASRQSVNMDWNFKSGQQSASDPVSGSRSQTSPPSSREPA